MSSNPNAVKCDMCEQEATVFLTQIVDGKMTQVNLCEQCSKDKGVTDPTGFQLADFLMGSSGGNTPKKSKVTERDDEALACPECGFTRAHLKKIGRMGCPECYKTFGEDMENMLRAMHKGTRHVGKIPGRPASMNDVVRKAPATPPTPPPPSLSSIKKKIGDLKSAIDLAVAEERYEDAAKLRDEVRSLEAKLV